MGVERLCVSSTSSSAMEKKTPTVWSIHASIDTGSRRKFVYEQLEQEGYDVTAGKQLLEKLIQDHEVVDEEGYLTSSLLKPRTATRALERQGVKVPQRVLDRIDDDELVTQEIRRMRDGE